MAKISCFQTSDATNDQVKWVFIYEKLQSSKRDVAEAISAIRAIEKNRNQATDFESLGIQSMTIYEMNQLLYELEIPYQLQSPDKSAAIAIDQKKWCLGRKRPKFITIKLPKDHVIDWKSLLKKVGGDKACSVKIRPIILKLQENENVPTKFEKLKISITDGVTGANNDFRKCGLPYRLVTPEKTTKGGECFVTWRLGLSIELCPEDYQEFSNEVLLQKLIAIHTKDPSTPEWHRIYDAVKSRGNSKKIKKILDTFLENHDFSEGACTSILTYLK